MKVTLYGASDDLIEVEGDIEDEFGAYDNPKFVRFNDGTVVKAENTIEGFWRFSKVSGPSECRTVFVATDPDGDYSDRMEIEGEFTRVSVWDNAEPTRREIYQHLEDYDWSDAPDAVLNRLADELL